EHRIRLRQAIRIQQSVALFGKLLEPDRVDLVAVEIERITVRTVTDDVGARAGRPTGLEVATQPRNVGDQRLLSRSRWLLAPELLDQIVDGDDPARAGDQAGEDRAFLRAGDRQRVATFPHDLQRSEDEETHRRRVVPAVYPS